MQILSFLVVQIFKLVTGCPFGKCSAFNDQGYMDILMKSVEKKLHVHVVTKIVFVKSLLMTRILHRNSEPNLNYKLPLPV